MAKIKELKPNPENLTCDDCKYYSAGVCTKFWVTVNSYENACEKIKEKGNWI